MVKFTFTFDMSSIMMSASCPCGLTKEEVLDLDRRGVTPLKAGNICQGICDDIGGICGKRLGAHPSAPVQAPQGKKIALLFDIDI